jgi:hypothetical protein
MDTTEHTHMSVSLKRLSDDALLARVKQLAADERRATVTLIAHLAELDRRRLYLAEGYSSLFTYCTEGLHLSEHAAYGRIAAARTASRFPLILQYLEEGFITLTTVCLVSRLLTPENHRRVLDASRHRSKRQVEELVATFQPLPPVPSSIRRLPEPRPSLTAETRSAPEAHPGPRSEAEAAGAPAESVPLMLTVPPQTPAARGAAIAPLAPQQYKVTFTASAEMYEKLQMAQALLRHQIPDGDPAAILDKALTVLLDTLTKQKVAATDRPREGRPASEQPVRPSPPTRHIPAEVRRAVWRRDEGRCAFVGAGGRRCSERGCLEFHHLVPYSAGGPATIDNIQLRCRAHNGYEARHLAARSGPSRYRAAIPARSRR